LKCFIVVVLLLATNAAPQVKLIKISTSLILFLLVIVSAGICATIPWTKMAGYCISLFCFVEIFIIATLQDDFSLNRRNSEDIKVSLSILLTFFVGLFGYFVTVACFCCQRNFKRQVY
jgi:hypothetical protein